MNERDDSGAGGAGERSRWPRGKHRSPVRWSQRRKAAFLDHLAATCNVSQAAEAAGVMGGSCYGLRRRDPAFAAAWAEALQLGYEMLETQLVGHALAGDATSAMTNGDVERTGPINVDLALKLLGTHRGAMMGKPFRGGAQPKRITAAEATAAVLKKLRSIEANARREAERALPALPAPTGDA
jgi:hypothetical protein